MNIITGGGLRLAQQRFDVIRRSVIGGLSVQQRPSSCVVAFFSKASYSSKNRITKSEASSSSTPSVNIKVVPKIKPSFNFHDPVKAFKFITPLRALREYILSSDDLDKIPRYYVRSPYTDETETEVYRRSDVELLAFDKHGGREAFELRRKLIKSTESRTKHDTFSIKKLQKSMLHPDLSSKYGPQSEASPGPSIFSTGSGRVVLFAIIVNSLNVGAKAIAWWLTGSKSVFSEMMHSIADTMNQILIAYGLHSSLQKPDEDHPYGYISMRNVSSLISGVTVFFLGSGLTLYHGVQGLLHPHEVESLWIALVVLSFSLVSEGSTLAVALNQARRSAKQGNYDSIRQWMLDGADPSTSVVILEDAAAVLGVLVAGTAMSISAWTGSPVPDALGAIGVSAILAGVAGLIIHTNTEALLARAIPVDKQEAINRVIENFRVIRGTYDIKATTMGSGTVRFKAEVDIDGRELTKLYLENIPLATLLEETKSLETEEQLVHFMLKHGDNIVNTLGAEINKIENRVKERFPDVKHIDIEIN